MQVIVIQGFATCAAVSSFGSWVRPSTLALKSIDSAIPKHELGRDKSDGNVLLPRLRRTPAPCLKGAMWSNRIFRLEVLEHILYGISESLHDNCLVRFHSTLPFSALVSE